MKLALNQTHRFGAQLADLTQDEIAACPSLGQGVSPEAIANGDVWVPGAVRDRLAQFPWGWGGARKYRWLYVRPQFCQLGAADTRSGNFYHLDVDAIYKSVAPAWDEFREIAVSFGDVAEVEFIDEPMNIEVGAHPTSNDYAALSGNFRGQYKTVQPANAQLALYTGLDAHRAGPIRRTGWRLFLIGFETDAEPQETWP